MVIRACDRCGNTNKDICACYKKCSRCDKLFRKVLIVCECANYFCLDDDWFSNEENTIKKLTEELNLKKKRYTTEQNKSIIGIGNKKINNLYIPTNDQLDDKFYNWWRVHWEIIKINGKFD